MFKNAFFAMFLALMFCAPAMSHDTDPDQTVLVGIMTKCNRGVPAKPLRAYTKPWKDVKLSAETHRKLSSMFNFPEPSPLRGTSDFRQRWTVFL